jgi:hypothetical protein
LAALTSSEPLPDAPPPPADPLVRTIDDCKEERQVCTDMGPGLWVEQNSGNEQATNTAEFDYRGGNSGFTLWYHGAQLAEVALQSDTPHTEGVLWPQLLPPYDTPCGCCDLCRAQPNNDVRAGRLEWLLPAAACCRLPPPAAAACRCLLMPTYQPLASLPPLPCSPTLPPAQQSARSGASAPLTPPAACSSTTGGRRRRPLRCSPMPAGHPAWVRMEGNGQAG